MNKHIILLTKLLIFRFTKLKRDNAINNIKMKSQWGKELIEFYIIDRLR